jgi:hypothetical protein
MAESAFNFDSAPNGNMRQFGVLAGALGLRSASNRRSSGGNSLSARDQAALAKQNAIHQAILSGQNHTQNLEMESHKAGLQRDNDVMGVVARHVVGEEAANSSHKRGLEVAYQDKLFKNTEGIAERAHKEKLASGKNSIEKAKIKADVTKERERANADVTKDYQKRLFEGTESQANREHTSSENTKNRSAATKAAKDPNVRSLNATTGAVTTTHPIQEPRQFSGVGEE